MTPSPSNVGSGWQGELLSSVSCAYAVPQGWQSVHGDILTLTTTAGLLAV